MPAYLLAGPAVALIGIVAIVFVMRHRSTEERSMYSSRRSQIQRKVQAARSRTLAPRGRGGKAPTEAEIAATQVAAPAYEAPVAPKQAWEMPAAPAAYAAPPAAPPPAYSPPAYEPPAQPAEPMPAPAPTFEPAPAQEEPVWTPAPAEPSWNPAATAAPAEAPAPAPAERTSAPQPASTPAGGGASWEIVGDVAPEQLAEPERGKGKDKDKDKRKEKAAAAAGGTSAWSLASGEAAVEPGAEDEGEMVKAPNPAMAIAQYAVLVVGLVMVLIGVLVMVANSKVT